MLSSEYLYYFMEVSKCASINAAAEKLHITPSAISHTLKKLENELNLTLFTRTSKGIQLTEHGEVIAKLSSNVLAQLKYIEETAARLSTATTMNVPEPESLILFGESAVFTIQLPYILGEFYDQFPNTDLIIAEKPSQYVFTQIMEDPDSIALLYIGSDYAEEIPKTFSGISYHTIKSFPIGIISNMNSKWVTDEKVSLLNLESVPIIFPDWNSTFKSSALAILTMLKQSNIVSLAPSEPVASSLLKNDVGVTLGAKYFAEDNKMRLHSFAKFTPIIDAETLPTIDYTLFYNQNIDCHFLEAFLKIVNTALTISCI